MHTPWKTRVTITLAPATHQRAKRTAAKRNTTVSGLIDALLQSAETPTQASLVNQMIGAATLRDPAPELDPLFNALKAKYSATEKIIIHTDLLADVPPSQQLNDLVGS
jgi:hypothetical protein